MEWGLSMVVWWVVLRMFAGVGSRFLGYARNDMGMWAGMTRGLGGVGWG